MPVAGTSARFVVHRNPTVSWPDLNLDFSPCHKAVEGRRGKNYCLLLLMKTDFAFILIVCFEKWVPLSTTVRPIVSCTPGGPHRTPSRTR